MIKIFLSFYYYISIIIFIDLLPGRFFICYNFFVLKLMGFKETRKETKPKVDEGVCQRAPESHGRVGVRQSPPHGGS